MAKILVVDRRPQLTRFLRGQRRDGNCSWDVLCAASGQEAIQVASAERELSVILVTDEILPGMTRDQVVEGLSALDLEVPVVLARFEDIQARPEWLAPFLDV
ncbi:MAG: hypothetical protein UY92_C0019G0009 [Candidatus Magasanikbacteria bacterium GW2011_GWA2_56_11]|uniref:Response regulatory domain-containing protein n=1 Tax=Candidatus Magasanikbacteria bacterium GW2011_GWA2_56_11 TaxID=1619044 RepID=A0A0G1YD66_9BACT|nr:MAG: hypothetical protein UY92_C0019G0009 [Candidatus Magasanikbacteria bacterium GW2011_GWA2_56_11]